MSKNKRSSAAATQQSKQEKRRAEQEKQKQKTRILIFSTVAAVVIIFVALIMLIPKDSSADFNYSEMARLGNENAPVKIVEFGDYKCPACSDFTGTIKPQLVEKYVTPGKAAFYFVNMAFIGPDSETASLAALSVYHQNSEAFWTYYDAIYANQGDENEEWATADYLVSLAKKENLPIDFDLLRKDIEERTYESELQRDMKVAEDTKVTSTPTVFVNGVKVDKAFDIEAISSQVQSALHSADVK